MTTFITREASPNYKSLPCLPSPLPAPSQPVIAAKHVSTPNDVTRHLPRRRPLPRLVPRPPNAHTPAVPCLLSSFADAAAAASRQTAAPQPPPRRPHQSHHLSRRPNRAGPRAFSAAPAARVARPGLQAVVAAETEGAQVCAAAGGGVGRVWERR